MKKFNKFCIAILITIVFYISRKSESFGSTSLVQLASSHIPTQEDLDYYTK